jgi:hypothetical protein
MPSVTCKADILTGPIFQVQVGIPSPLTESGRCRMASFGRPIGPSLGAKANRHSSVAWPSCAQWPKPVHGVPWVLKCDTFYHSLQYELNLATKVNIIAMTIILLRYTFFLATKLVGCYNKIQLWQYYHYVKNSNRKLSLWLWHGYYLRHLFRYSERRSLKLVVVRWRIMCGWCRKSTQKHTKI